MPGTEHLAGERAETMLLVLDTDWQAKADKAVLERIGLGLAILVLAVLGLGVFISAGRG